MPADLTIFVASYLIYIEAVVAALALAYLLFRRPRTELVRWTLSIGITLIVAYIAAQIGSALYSDPRPFAVDHVRPLIEHAADNGFPSDHALLAAAIVAAVAFARLIWAALFVVPSVLVEWARVGAGVHHPIDVIGSDLLVALGAVIALVLAPPLGRALLPYIPDGLLALVAGPDARAA